MADGFYSQLLSGSYTQPDSLINAGIGPLPSIPSWAPPQLQAIPDGRINDRDQLLASLAPYSYGTNPNRISTQTQMAHPNKVELVIPRLFIPAAQSMPGCVQDPLLEHATTDGDLVFSLMMNITMQSLGRQYVIMPYSNTQKSMKLVNLATVNYLLWGLQVGSNLGEGREWRWKAFFSNLCLGAQKPYEGGNYTAEVVWNFLQTYLTPFGVQHGSDRQGGMHEGSKERIANAANEYVSTFAVEGKLHKVNNYWRCSDIDENDDLVLELTFMPPQASIIPFSLSSSSRATRVENATVPLGWWYLSPTVLKYKTVVPAPHIHIGRAQKMLAGYQGNKWGLGMPPWNARACAVGSPVLMTFEPGFVLSDEMLYRKMTAWEMPGHCPEKSLTQRQLAEAMPESSAHVVFGDNEGMNRVYAALERRREKEEAELQAALEEERENSKRRKPGRTAEGIQFPAAGVEAGVTALAELMGAPRPSKKIKIPKAVTVDSAA